MSQEAFSVFCVSAKQNSRLWGKNEKVKQKTKKFKGSLQFSDVKFFPHRGIIRHSLTKWEKKMFRKKNKEKSSTRKFCPNWTGPEIICIYSDYHLSHCSNVTFLNGPTPASFIVYFWSFQTNIITIFTTNICEKYLSSIRCQDSNPQPPHHESPFITTRLGLPLYFNIS